MIIPDINLIVYAHDETTAAHPPARQWWERTVTGAEPVGLPWVCVLGFVRLLSNPRVVQQPAPAADLMARMQRVLALSAVRPAVPGAQHAGLMQRLFDETGATGRLTTDIHLAALAIEHGATLASTDTDFARFSELKWVNPIT
ncbi:MAG: PIN domain-containing protein [Spirochaetes bacterium]|jgi:toxin-antitoxin system PIN domain toxin|nr:PIN domain-containing protein [Spirochaetota bacterium]